MSYSEIKEKIGSRKIFVNGVLKNLDQFLRIGLVNMEQINELIEHSSISWIENTRQGLRNMNVILK